MQIAYGCLLIAVFLPYVWVYFAKFGKSEDGTAFRYNNYSPRLQQAKLEGFRARAVWAHNNAFEALPAFAAALLLAVQAGVAAETINITSVVFICARILHGAFYLANRPSLRSAVWFIGFVAVVYMLVEAILGVA
ncbi:MAPEG family protein [Chitinimonas sp. PSY-7]|uniref:MAPEG family protein n=1 Tax=Chitinimonas sp. PSY-7 TaxID=3459088 RepID=UPI00403FF7AD